MTKNQATEFYERLVEGQDHIETIDLEHNSGATLEGVEIHPVNKKDLGYVMETLPEELFDALDEADDPDEAEEMMEESDDELSLSAMNEDTIEGFEYLLKNSLRHDNLTSTQMDKIIESLDFGVLFEIGGKIIDSSFAESGAVKDFHERD